MYTVHSLPNENLSIGVTIVDRELSIKYVNLKFSNILQKKASDLLGKKISGFIPEITNVFSLKNQHYYQKVRRNNGQVLALDIVAILEKPNAEYLIFCQDYTQYEQLMEQYDLLHEQIQLYMQMFDKLSDGIYICDEEGMTLYLNESFAVLSGLKREKLIHVTIYDALEQGLIPNSCIGLVLKTKEPASAIIKYPYGKSCLVSGFPIFINGKLTRAIGVVRDLTELKSLQDQLENATSLNLSYKHKLQEIEKKNSSIDVIETRSTIMHNIYDKVIRIAAVDCPIFLRGETGVGKDFLAKFIHENSEFGRTGCLIKVNCGAIPENLLESELFGYEKGAFTGANKDGKAGLFELANNGTLFLDEIGDMPLHLQVKLLNSIQDKKFFRVGGTRVITLNARIIAATNVDLEKMIAEGKFRLDLYYRLNVISIQIPPLRNRRDDILPLALRFLNDFNFKYNKSCYFSPKTMGLLLNYTWPGNIREMRNIIERVVIMSEQNCLEPAFFEESIVPSNNTQLVHTSYNSYNSSNHLSLKAKVEIFESSCIQESLNLHDTQKETADSLGIDLSTLVRKKHKYRLSKKAE